MRVRLASPIFFALALVGAAPAWAGPKECVAAHERALSDYQDGKLRAAKEKVQECALETCPAMIRGECLSLFEKIAADQPTIVVSATDGSGADLVEIRVFVGAQELARRLDGRALEIDPGQHSVRFEAPDGESRTVRVLVKQGEKNRRVIARFAKTPGDEPAAPPPAPKDEPDAALNDAERPGAPTAAWVLGGVGVLALGSFSYFALQGKSEQQDLEDRCAPTCSKDEYRTMKRQYLFADISLGAAAVSLGVATYLFLAPREESPKTEIGLGVAPGSARIDWRTRF